MAVSPVTRFAQILTCVVLLAIIILGACHSWEVPFRKELSLKNIMGSLGALFVIVLLVERATEILIGIWRAPKSAKMERDAARMAAEPEKHEAMQHDLRLYKTGTKGIALLIGFTISIVVCVAGVGLFSDLLDLSQADEEWQVGLLRGLDILLTSSLIAGGSDGFHQFTSAIETFFRRSKENMLR